MRVLAKENARQGKSELKGNVIITWKVISMWKYGASSRH